MKAHEERAGCFSLAVGHDPQTTTAGRLGAPSIPDSSTKPLF
jgi:hypothetical protein